ncbi:YdhK family protein [Paenibacillus azoreducens]|nr:YdhK family protein [Paenibacillus azoreducens]
MNQWLVFLCIAATLILSACGDSNNTVKSDSASESSRIGTTGMHYSDSNEVPKGLKAAEDPMYHVGKDVVIHAKRVEGMDGATGTVVGAYDTIAYSVTYMPTNGGKPVPNHRWVIQEEIKDAGSEPLKQEEMVTLEADHIEGMMGAQAMIDTAKKTTVYMVDYIPTTGGPPVKNCKWFVERELSIRHYRR